MGLNDDDAPRKPRLDDAVDWRARAEQAEAENTRLRKHNETMTREYSQHIEGLRTRRANVPKNIRAIAMAAGSDAAKSPSYATEADHVAVSAYRHEWGARAIPREGALAAFVLSLDSPFSIEVDAQEGYYVILEDGIVIARSKSDATCRRIIAALERKP